ncbi:hypothetical protein OIE43_20965 [Streptomyces pseudovenezuelae]|uniref:hypothetical protein n=1 Tax=Streptomyces pseudovenezuelae TaxID=67350 RepID=UPI002E331F5D|nr:hypothetical protein [Streptomyces pseudovenezuelae]
MNTMEAAGLTLARCCAHLVTFDDGPLTAPSRTAAVTADLPAEARAPESVTAARPAAVRLTAIPAVGA